MLIGITENMKCKRRVEHGWNNPCPVARRVLALDDPALGGINRSSAQRDETSSVSQLQKAISSNEDRTGETPVGVFEIPIAALRPLNEELIRIASLMVDGLPIAH